MNNRKSIINTLKVRVPRHWLFFGMASFWLFASLRIFLTAWEGIVSSKTPVVYFILISFIGSLIFTRLVFSKVTAKYIVRIHSMIDEQPSLFSMFSLKSYLLIAFMISMGISVRYFHLVPENILSIFLGALGLSLFTSAIQFFRAFRPGTVN